MKLADLVVAGMPALMKKYGHKITAHQRQALHAIIDCRTGALGSTLMSCDDCHHKQLRHRSCGHRSCPQCQHHSNQAWLERQQAKLLPVSYFMVTFTLPAQLRALLYANPTVCYNALFDVALGTLKTFASNDPQLNGELGACAILHTNTRRLDYHPHIHFIVPACAVNRRRKQWRKHKGDYLFNGRQLATVFRPRMLEAIHQLALTMPDNLPGKWNVQCKLVGKGLPALQYLSRYLYRGVIRDKDLMHFDPDQKQVTFRYRQSQSGEYRYRTLPLEDFLWRITMQVLPKGFRRVRDYGLLHGNAKSRMILLQVLLHVQLPPPIVKTVLAYNCLRCQAAMRIVGFLQPRTFRPD
jgi:hypothetical protein